MIFQSYEVLWQISQPPTTAILSGSVTDQNGVPLPNAIIPEIIDVGGNPVATDENGNFQGEVNKGDFTINKVIVNGTEYGVGPIVFNVSGDLNIGTVVVNRV